MRFEILVALTLAAFIVSPSSSLAKCACEDKSSLDSVTQQAMNAAFKLPSEADRSLARNLRKQGLPVDAAQYYLSASSKAAVEIADARSKMAATTAATSASDLEQISLHSASIHREAASFFTQQGNAKDAAINWEQRRLGK
jgi:hypothetical protein